MPLRPHGQGEGHGEAVGQPQRDLLAFLLGEPASRHRDLLVLPGHGLDTTIGDERPHLQEWIDRGW